MQLRASPFVAMTIVLATGPVAATPFVNEVVDDGGALNDVGQYASLAIDSHDNPHIAYYDATAQDLFYATRVDGAWLIEQVDGGNLTGSHCSIAVDSQDVPHIAYYNAEVGVLRYGVRTGGVWATETADDPLLEIVGTHTAIVIDALDRPHVAYYDLSSAVPKYALKDGGVWTVEAIDDEGGTHMTLALDSDDVPHALYSNGDETAGQHADRHGGAWSQGALLAGADAANDHLSLVLSPNNHELLAFGKAGTNEVRFRGRFDVTSQLVANVVSPHGVSLAVDDAGTPGVSYRGNRVYFARGDAGVWTEDVVDYLPTAGGGTGSTSSLALDAQGNPHIAYYADFEGDLKYAYAAVRLETQLAGAIWPVGADRSIAWSGLGPVDIELSVDGGGTYEPFLLGVQTSPVGLRVPHAPTRFARVRVSRDDAFSTDESDSLFTIEASIGLLSFTVSPPANGAPGALLAWESNPGLEDLAGYKIERAAGSGWAALAALVRETTYLDPQGRPGDRYRVSAVNGLGTAYVLAEGTLGVEAPLTAWPVPYTGGMLEVSFATLGGLAADAAPARVALFDVAGRMVRTIAEGDFTRDRRSATWDGRDSAGRLVPSGVYFLRLETAGNTSTFKLTVLR